MKKQRGESVFLLDKYFHLGWLNRRYFVDGQYMQPYSAADRLLAGKCLYADFCVWQRGTHMIRDYDMVYVDVSPKIGQVISEGHSVERFRRALRHISKATLPVVYQIVLEEREIVMPYKMSAREKLYFNDEIKGLLCRGLDELVPLFATS